MKIVSQVGKTPTVLTDFSQPFNTGPLIDQNGNYTRYEILVNKPMFDYILSEHALLEGWAESVFRRGEVSVRSSQWSRGRNHG